MRRQSHCPVSAGIMAVGLGMHAWPGTGRMWLYLEGGPRKGGISRVGPDSVLPR